MRSRLLYHEVPLIQESFVGHLIWKGFFRTPDRYFGTKTYQDLNEKYDVDGKVEKAVAKAKETGINAKAKVKEIAEIKMPDLNAANIESAMSMIAGTARSMGVEVVD